MQRTRLETFHQSRVVVVVDVVIVVVVVFVGAYSPVTGNPARQLRGSTPPDDVGPIILLSRIAAPLLAVAGTRTGEGRDVSGDALPPLSVDAPPDKGYLTSTGKGSADPTRVARLLLMMSSDVTATDDEATRAFSTGFSSFAIPNVSSATGPPKEMAGSERGVNGQGRVFCPLVNAVRTGPSGRAPFSSSTRALAGLAAGWISQNEMQGFSSESSRTGRSHELQIPGTLGGRTWAKCGRCH